MSSTIVKRVTPERRHKLYVPCVAWIYSQKPRVANGSLSNKVDPELKAPMTIKWIEAMLPLLVKRKLEYLFLDERGGPLRSNLSQGIRRDNTEFADTGFNVHCTNTYRYVFPVPKLHDYSNNNSNPNFAGWNLWHDYDTTAYVESYIADDLMLINQGLIEIPAGYVAGTPLPPGYGTILSQARGTLDEQYLYRNAVIEECEPSIAPLTLSADMDDRTCSTNQKLSDLMQPELSQIAAALLWNADVWLQYAVENTYRNFQLAGYGGRVMQQAHREFRMLEILLFAEKNYRIGPNGILVSPPTGVIAAGLPGAGLPDESSRRPILGMRRPELVAPWTESDEPVAPIAGG